MARDLVVADKWSVLETHLLGGKHELRLYLAQRSNVYLEGCRPWIHTLWLSIRPFSAHANFSTQGHGVSYSLS